MIRSPQNVNGSRETINGKDTKLTRIAELLEVSVRLQMAPILERELADPKLRELYDTTGTMPATELAKSLRMSATTICSAWKRWGELGLMVKDGKSYRKVF